LLKRFQIEKCDSPLHACATSTQFIYACSDKFIYVVDRKSGEVVKKAEVGECLGIEIGGGKAVGWFEDGRVVVYQG